VAEDPPGGPGGAGANRKRPSEKAGLKTGGCSPLFVEPVKNRVHLRGHSGV
jgi:hypothetical protein